MILFRQELALTANNSLHVKSLKILCTATAAWILSVAGTAMR